MTHGGNVWAGGDPAEWLDYSANIRPGGPPEWVRAALLRFKFGGRQSLATGLGMLLAQCAAEELGGPVCTTCGSAPVVRESEHLYFELEPFKE